MCLLLTDVKCTLLTNAEAKASDERMKSGFAKTQKQRSPNKSRIMNKDRELILTLEDVSLLKFLSSGSLA